MRDIFRLTSIKIRLTLNKYQTSCVYIALFAAFFDSSVFFEKNALKNALGKREISKSCNDV